MNYSIHIFRVLFLVILVLFQRSYFTNKTLFYYFMLKQSNIVLLECYFLDNNYFCFYSFIRFLFFDIFRLWA